MLFTHLDLTTDEVTARLNQDWQADIAAYDKNHTHMLNFSVLPAIASSTTIAAWRICVLKSSVS